MRIPVVVTEPEFRKAEAVFLAAEGLDCRPAGQDEAGLTEAIRTHGARHAIVGILRYQDALYRALPRGGVLARFGVGHDGIDKQKAAAAGLLCTNTPGVLDSSVAECAMAMILAAARDLPKLDSDMRSGTWRQRQGSDIGGKTLAVIGCGPISRAVARMASAGFGMRVVGQDIRPDFTAEAAREYGIGRLEREFAAAVAEADFVSLHIPATPENARFLNAERLRLLPRGAWVINTARGAVVDEAALYDALKEGRIGGAALDVFEREPYEPVSGDRDLRTLPNVILTPHIGSNTREANRRIAGRALANIQHAIRCEWEAMDLLYPRPRDGEES